MLHILGLMHRLTFLSVLLCLLAAPAAAAAPANDPAITLLHEAAPHRGDAVITSGEFRYQLSVTTKLPTQEEIDREIEHEREMLRLGMDRPGMTEKIRKRYQQAMDTADEWLPPQLIRNAGRLLNFFFILGDEQAHHDRFVEFAFVDRGTNNPGPPTRLLQRPGDAATQTNLFADGGIKTIVATHQGMSLGTQEPQRLGRLLGVLERIFASPRAPKDPVAAGLITDLSVAPLDDKEIGHLGVVTCTIQAEGAARAKIIIHVDPARGYITPLVQESNANGELMREWVSEEYFQPTGSDLWFPKFCTYTVTEAAAPEKPCVERYEFTPAEVKLNIPTPPTRLAMTLPRGANLHDDLADDDLSYFVNEETKLSIDDLADLTKVPGLGLTHVAGPTRARGEGPPRSELRGWLIALNVAIVAAILAVLFLLRHRRARFNT